MDERIRIDKLTFRGGGAVLTITGEEQPLQVSLDSVHRHRLVAGIIVTPPQLAKLREEAELYQCDRVAARLLAMRDHSVGELVAKLRRRQFAMPVVQAVLRKYREAGALDDARYAAAVGGSLLARRPCGKGYLTAYLQKRKIERDLAEQTVEALLSKADDNELALAALEQRWSRFSYLELESARTKAYNYLARRGFGYYTAKVAFDRLWQKRKKGSENQDS